MVLDLGLKNPLRLCWPLPIAAGAVAEDPDLARFKDLLVDTSPIDRFVPATDGSLDEATGAVADSACALSAFVEVVLIAEPPLTDPFASKTPASLLVTFMLCDC